MTSPEQLPLETLIDKRDHDKRRFTAKIIATFRDNLTEAAKRVIGMDRNINWFSIERTPHTQSFVNIHGYVEVRPGDTINFEGKMVVVAEGEERNYNNVLNLTVALPLLQTGTVDALYEHLMFVLTAIRETPSDVLIELLEKGVKSQLELYVNPAHHAILEKMTRPRYVAGFDTSGLSNIQMESLSMTMASNVREDEKAN